MYTGTKSLPDWIKGFTKLEFLYVSSCHPLILYLLWLNMHNNAGIAMH